MKGEKIQGEPCKQCQGVIFYSNCGSCVSCVSDRNSEADKKRALIESEINEPYQKCYNDGRKGKSENDCPYLENEIGKRCAWLAGFNDNS